MPTDPGLPGAAWCEGGRRHDPLHHARAGPASRAAMGEAPCHRAGRDLDERPDLVRRNFTAESPGCKLRGDIAYVSTWAGFVCLATVLDCCTKKVVGYAMVAHMRTSLVRGH